MYEESRKLLKSIIDQQEENGWWPAEIEVDGLFRSALSDTLFWYKESERFNRIRTLLLSGEPVEVLDEDDEFVLEANDAVTIIEKACRNFAMKFKNKPILFEIDITLRNAIVDACSVWYKGHVCFQNLKTLLKEIQTY
jgi:hypothetical protein